jgi:UDP-N-acetylmuramoyl-tripeptide--D-alanyl-D-alanine ligase
MATLTLDDVAKAVGGQRVQGEASLSLRRYAIDSRAVEGGELFFALRGPNHDGHDFLPEAFARGAAAAVISRPDGAGLDLPADRGIVRAPDTTRALQDLAAAVRRRSGARVVGITGSCGKTTAKEMTAAVLAARWRVHPSRGNLNNTFGLPLTTLEMPDDAELLVLEMGMSYPGEIARLVEIADPDIGVVLNVSEVHRENFSSVEEIARAKGELLRGMRSEGTAVYNATDARARSLGLAFPGRRICFAVESEDGRLDNEPDIAATDVRDDIVSGARFTLCSKIHPPTGVRLALFGRHNVANAAAALAVAHAMGMDLGQAAAAIETVGPVAGRGVVERLGNGVVLVDETYNSNPAAVRSVLASLAASSWPGRRVLAFGDMLELGEEAGERHHEAGAEAGRAGVVLLLAVGPLAAKTAAGARTGGIEQVSVHGDSEAAAEGVSAWLRPGDLVLVKGSRGIRMEKVAEAVRIAAGPAQAGGAA